MRDRLQDSFNRLTEFSWDIAHALRNPLNNRRGETEVALGRARTPGEYRQNLASSLEEFDRLSRMIEGRLFIARAEDPRTALTPVPLGARHELDAVSELSEARAADQCVTVRGEGEADFVADPMLVRRAVSHLLGHALKDTPPGGTVRRWRRGRCTKARRRSVVPIRGPASRRSTCRGFSTGFPGRQEQVGLLARFIVRAVLSWGELAPAGVNGKLFAESYRAPLLVWSWWWPAMVWRGGLSARAGVDVRRKNRRRGRAAFATVAARARERSLDGGARCDDSVARGRRATRPRARLHGVVSWKDGLKGDAVTDSKKAESSARRRPGGGRREAGGGWPEAGRGGRARHRKDHARKG